LPQLGRGEMIAPMQEWTSDERLAMRELHQFLAETAESTPVCAGVSDVIFAGDRDAVLTAVKRYPELLTDRGDAAFRMAALMTAMMSPGRLTDVVQRARADIQAIREASA
jgi:hypothetical protein